MNDGERLYNGIVLPREWPPRTLNAQLREPPIIPYLESPPEVIPIDVGRQLFVDDFLIQDTDLHRTFHRAEKYEKNPILKPETALEMNGGNSPVACPFSGGVFYDPRDRIFKMWYHAGWFDGTAYATSKDGIHWDRPALDVVPGTNRVLPRDIICKGSRRDGVSVWLDQEAEDPKERYKMFLYVRPHHDQSGNLLTSPDGIHWTVRGRIGPCGDNTSFFYNPFRKKWVFSIRTSRADRTRDYWEQDSFVAPHTWTAGETVCWGVADDLDRPDAVLKEQTQLYKIDAIAYESIMLGYFQIFKGYPGEHDKNEGNVPKITELTLGYSRDGFHFHRPDRQAFIGASQKEGAYDRNYVHSVGGFCLIAGDRLYFYFSAFSGVSPKYGTCIYAGGSTCLAFLRRDGFASMDADAGAGYLTTRPVTFSGKYLFVNVDSPHGEFRAELLTQDGGVIEPFSAANCEPVAVDKTLHMVTWRGAEDLSSVVGKPVRFKFHLANGKLYAFWVSPDRSGTSGGYVAAGGPEFAATRDLETGN